MWRISLEIWFGITFAHAPVSKSALNENLGIKWFFSVCPSICFTAYRCIISWPIGWDDLLSLGLMASLVSFLTGEEKSTGFVCFSILSCTLRCLMMGIPDNFTTLSSCEHKRIIVFCRRLFISSVCPYLTSRVDQSWSRVNSGKLSELDQSLIRSLFTLDRVALD